MELTFSAIIDFVAGIFGGSTTLAGLALLIGAWAICAVICLNLRAPPTYTVVPMIPLAVFFVAYGVLNEMIAVVIIVVCAVLIASQFRRVVE